VRDLRQGLQSNVEFGLSQGESARTDRQEYEVLMRSMRKGLSAQVCFAVARGIQARYKVSKQRAARREGGQ